MTIWQERLAELRAAFLLLSRLPAGKLPEPPPKLAQSHWAYPLVGAAIGALAWAVFSVALWVGWSAQLAALLALASAALATGGLHQDGLADFADGVGGGRDRAAKLAIMRDSRIGTYGVLALIFFIAAKAGAIAQAMPGLWQFVLIGAASRAAMLGALHHMPSARQDGLGTLAAPDLGAPSPLVPVAAIVGIFAVLAGWSSVMVLVLLAAGALVPAVIAQRKLGGQTGDVLGTIQQAAALGGWLALAWIA